MKSQYISLKIYVVIEAPLNNPNLGLNDLPVVEL